ncbi:hypothetical protein D3C78_1590310 [compost metagenome]
MEQRLAFIGKTRGAIGHQAFALGGPDGLAEVGLAREAEFALPTFSGVERDHVVADLQRRHAFADGLDDTAALMPQHRGENAFGIAAREGESVGMANASGDDANPDFTGLGRRYIDGD